MSQSRRNFLKSSATAVSGAAFLTGLHQFGTTGALAQSSTADYKAMVCIFLDGGNDGNNMIIPYDDYAPYQTVRGASGLAIPKTELLQIAVPSHGKTFGLNPRLSPEVENPAVPGGKGILELYQQGKVAVLANVGPLIAPLTKALYQTRPDLRPYQLGSHSDQQDQHMTAISNLPSVTGWGGRAADLLNSINNGPTGPPPLPMSISTAGTSIMLAGAATRPLAIAGGNTPLNQILVLNMTGSAAERQARGVAFDRIRNSVDAQILTKAYNETTGNSLLAASSLSVDPTLTTAFPNSGLGNQLRQVAKLMKANLVSASQPALGLKRQVFFTRISGFDTHSDQRNGGQDSLLQQVGQAMRAFYAATVELGIADKVVTFTLSDFGRTLDPAGTGTNVGSDHAWGNHQLIMGGGVRGGDFYGKFPELVLKGPDDSEDRGRWIPTTSIDQYGATLSQWFGLPASELPKVFPYIGRFASNNLGFMA